MTADFDEFFTQHYDQIVRSVTAVAGDRELAADCVQEAFIRAYARWRRINRYDLPSAWVRRVALNRLKDELRSRDRRVAREDRSMTGTTRTTENAEPDQDVIDALAQLPLRQRTAVALHYLDDQPVRQIARIMRISEGAVKFHLSAGREQLEALLAATAEEGR